MLCVLDFFRQSPLRRNSAATNFYHSKPFSLSFRARRREPALSVAEWEPLWRELTLLPFYHLKSISPPLRRGVEMTKEKCSFALPQFSRSIAGDCDAIYGLTLQHAAVLAERLPRGEIICLDTPKPLDFASTEIVSISLHNF